MKRESILSEQDARLARKFLEAQRPEKIKILAVKYSFKLGVAQILYEDEEDQNVISIPFSYEILEDLNHHSNPIVAKAAVDIVVEMGNPKIYPSWMIMECALIVYKRRLDIISEKLRADTKNYKAAEINKQYYLEESVWCKNVGTSNKIFYSVMRAEAIRIVKLCLSQIKLKGVRDDCDGVTYPTKFQALKEAWSTWRYAKQNKRSAKKRLRNHKRYSKKLKKENKKFFKLRPNYIEKVEIAEAEKEAFKRECDKVISLAAQLPILVTPDSLRVVFIPLAEAITGELYKDIAGCYIIRNRENYKCYVGQSNNIHRRLNEHFRGTEPQNIIFAKDYYSSQMKDKSQMFEVRAIPEPDDESRSQLERDLIEKYDSFHNGYNRNTGG